ncbi:unnamed protein product [Allacma fusca]|uniref:Uncharacterized protein n=1 Tax=Allacma fusca TaxID=39272 RepID=A0A8J2PBF6_9HEXA|nr:unnamed protein product [Allacma fusca]
MSKWSSFHNGRLVDYSSASDEGDFQDEFQNITEDSLGAAFTVTPWDLVRNSDEERPTTSTRKPRLRQKSELMTSEENFAKLKQKEIKMRKKDSSDSDDRRMTRQLTTAQKRKHRSGVAI